MIPQNLQELIEENERLGALVEDLSVLAQDRGSLLELDAKRWETLCALMDMGAIDIVYDFSHRGFSGRWNKFVRLKGTPQELTPEALKSWLDKEGQ